MRRILVTGALGQIGSELIPALQDRYGAAQVVASDLRVMPFERLAGSASEHLDCTQPQQVLEVIRRHDIGTIYHLAALLSAVAEERPHVAWSVNMGGLYNVLEAARQYRCQVFFPSSIGAFGPSTPREHTPQVTVQRPTTMYGVTKVAGELLCDYYASRFGVDTRGLRLPGLISYVAMPGGGTTDYAVEIFYSALRYKHYACFLKPDTRLEHDVHAGRDRRDDRADGGGCGAALPPQRLQRDRHEHHAGRARRRDPQAHPRFRHRLSGRSRPPGDRRFLAAVAR
jgi:nucleoside-diphosphate-sugar epimerase